MKRSLTMSCLAATCLVATSLPAQAYDAGDWVVRARLISVSPNDDSGNIEIGGIPVPGSGVSVDSDVVPELDFTYMLTSNWGLELILATSSHDADATGTLASLGHIVNAKALPPTLTLQYHFQPNSNIRPYAGVGLNYTHFYDEDTTGALNGLDVDLDDSWGLAAQVGVDIDINNDWFVNFDAKYIDISTTADIEGGIEVDIDVDPWVFGIGIGTTF